MMANGVGKVDDVRRTINWKRERGRQAKEKKMKGQNRFPLSRALFYFFLTFSFASAFTLITKAKKKLLKRETNDIDVEEANVACCVHTDSSMRLKDFITDLWRSMFSSFLLINHRSDAIFFSAWRVECVGIKLFIHDDGHDVFCHYPLVVHSSVRPFTCFHWPVREWKVQTIHSSVVNFIVCCVTDAESKKNKNAIFELFWSFDETCVYSSDVTSTFFHLLFNGWWFLFQANIFY